MLKAHKMAFFSLCPVIALLFCLKTVARTICSINSSSSGSSGKLHGFLFLPLWHSFSHNTTQDTVVLASLCLGHHGYLFLIADQTIFVESKESGAMEFCLPISEERAHHKGERHRDV